MMAHPSHEAKAKANLIFYTLNPYHHHLQP